MEDFKANCNNCGYEFTSSQDIGLECPKCGQFDRNLTVSETLSPREGLALTEVNSELSPQTMDLVDRLKQQFSASEPIAHTLHTEPGNYVTTGGNCSASIYSRRSGRRILVDHDYKNAQDWFVSFSQRRCHCFQFEERLITSLQQSTWDSKGFPLYRGRRLEIKPNDVSSLGPPPSNKASLGRYNSAGEVRLYLTSEVFALPLEVPGAQNCPIYFVEYELDKSLAIADARNFGEDHFSSAVFRMIENFAPEDYSEFGHYIVNLISNIYDGMIVPGVHGDEDRRYFNVIVFKPDRWTDWIGSEIKNI